MGFVQQDRILQPFLQIFFPLSGGRIDTFWSRKRTKQPRPGIIRPPSESGKECKPGGSGGAGGRAETGGAGAGEGRDRSAPGPKKDDAGGRSREGDVAGKGRGKAGAGKRKTPGLEEGQCGEWTRRPGRRGGREDAVSIQQRSGTSIRGSSAPQGDAGSAI